MGREEQRLSSDRPGPHESSDDLAPDVRREIQSDMRSGIQPGIQHGRPMLLLACVLVGAAAAATAGCSMSEGLTLPKINDINPFAKTEPPLPGKRVPIMEATGSIANNLAAADRPIVLPPPSSNENWPQPGGTASNSAGHPALAAAPKVAWSASAGTGSGKTGKVTASPIVFDGRVYALDADARVTAFTVASGAVAWRTSLVPESERKAGSMFTIGSSSVGGGYGGGIAVDDGKLFVATGYGTVAALDPKSGKTLWTKQQSAPIRAAPTAVGGRVYVVTSEGKVLAIAGSDGSELWAARGVTEQASLIGSPSPAVDGDMLVAPFPSGEVVGLKLGTGEQVWTESLTRARGGTAIGALSDAARPVIDRGQVFATAHGGRTSALQARTGERIWSVNIPSVQAPWVAGDYVFVLDTGGQLLSLDRRTGQTLWTTKLPDSNIWSGPTLAGGQLWSVSAKGRLIGVDAATGRVASQASVGSPSFIPPVVAGNKMFILTDSARLIAFR
jgi:outer membrane protein assembly factor BamB